MQAFVPVCNVRKGKRFMQDTVKTKRKWFWLLIVALAAYIIKNIFVGADTDEGYGIMVGYRLAKGDRLLLDMWEPHQTSAVFTALFIKPFLWLTGGNPDFLNIYLRIVYFVINGLVTFFAYRTFRVCTPKVGKNGALGLALILFVCSPKSVFVPEYSNLHIWFFALLCMSLMWYYCPASTTERKLWVLVAAGICLTCDVLTYPSMVLLFPVLLGFIVWKKGDKLLRELLAFCTPCVVSAGILLGYVLSYMTPEQVFHVLPYIMSDGSHQTSFGEKLLQYLANLGAMGVLLCIGFAVAAALAGIYVSLRKRKGKKVNFAGCFLVLLFVSQIIFMFYTWFTSVYNAGYTRIIYFAIAITGLWCYLKSGKTEKTGFYLILTSAVNYVAVMLLSNWLPELLTPYFVMGAIGGLLCWKSYFDEKDLRLRDSLILILSMLLVFSCIFGYCFRIIGGELTPSTIFEIRGYNHAGFRKWIMTSYMTAYRYNKNMEIWPEAVPDGSTVLYVGPSQFFYMLGDCTIASPNTISTPTYDESLLEYWELHPDRYPDVVVLESWFGDVRVTEEDDFIMQWLENDFCATEVVDYPYITVYKK